MNTDLKEILRIDIDDIADSPGELMGKLLNGELPNPPFWLQVGDSGFLVSEENRKHLNMGMLLYLEVKEYSEKREYER